MDDRELEAAALAEIKALEESGAGMPFTLRPSEGFFLLGLLQLALRHPNLETDTPGAGAYGKALAQNIEERLGRDRPALAELARRGWEAQYDRKSEKTEAAEPIRCPAETQTRSDTPKQGRKRARK